MTLPNLMGSALGGLSLGRAAHVSTENKQFSAVSGNETRPISQFDQQRGAIFVEFMVVGVSPNAVRMHYPLKSKDPVGNAPATAPQVSTYDPANRQAPICISENGRGPSFGSRAPQAPVCAQCWASKWGSAISQRGERIPACTEKKRLVVIVPSFGWDTPLQFDIPPAAFRNWASLIQMLRDGKISELESVVIRAYFIANEDGFLEFVPSPNGFATQQFGENALPSLHHHMLSQSVQKLSGALDQPIDPATWTPDMANSTIPAPYGQPQGQIAAPAAQPGVQGQPAVTYAPAAPIETTGAMYVQQAAQQHYAPAPAAPAPQQHYAPAPAAPAPQQHYAPAPAAPAPQQQYAPAPAAPAPQQQYAPAPAAPAPQQQYAPAPAAPAPQQQYAPAPQQHYAPQGQLPAPEHYAPQPGAEQGTPIEGEPARRKRRTKVEMEAARALEALQAAPGAQQHYAPAPAPAAPAPQAAPQTYAPMEQTAPQAAYGMAAPSGATDALRNQLNSALTMQFPQGM